MPNWDDVLKEIRVTPQVGQTNPIDIVRRKYLEELSNHTSRNVIAYYSAFLSKPTISGIEINDEDKNGFMLCVHELDRNKGLDIILHTPGGNVAATESLVAYLKEMFGRDVRAIVPQLAMSAGTMIACSCKEILMGKHSNLGPIDPQMGGIPAIGVLQEIEKAFEDIKKDPLYAAIWNPILGKLPPSFVKQCHWAIERSKQFVEKALQENMFFDLVEEKKLQAVEKASEKLSDLSNNKSHDKHFDYRECMEMGLKVKMLEEEGNSKLQDLVLTVHHCYMHSLSNTPSFKIIENHLGRAFIKVEQNQFPGMFIGQPQALNTIFMGQPQNLNTL